MKRDVQSSHAFSQREMFMKFKSKRLGIKLAPGSKKNITLYSRALAARVFAYAFITMLDDVIDNNVIFKLPVKNESYIELQKLDKEELAKARQNGGFKDLDILLARFYGIQLQYRFKSRKGYSIRKIIVDSKRKHKMYDNLYKKKY